MQDTHFLPDLEPYIAAEWGYQCYFSSYASNSRGVAILFNNTFEFQVLDTYKGDNGNYLMVLIKVKGREIMLVNVYGPNRDNPNFYNNLSDVIRKFNTADIIIGGDYNLVLDPSRDYDNYKHVNNPNAQQAVENMINELNMCDIWRELNPDCRRFTWRRTNPFQQSRLDFFLLSESLVSIVEDADIKYGYRTDHSMVTLKLKFGDKSKQNTFWKHNASLLKDKKYVEEINSLIDEVVSEYAVFPYARESIVDIPRS